MKKIFLILAISFYTHLISAQTSLFNNLLQAHVSENGVVDYKNFDGVKLKKHLNYLEKTSPDKTWSINKQKAFWINAYNANTIYLMLHAIDTKKIKSILDIKEKGKNAWKISFAKVGGKTYTLDYIEHEILRKKFSDPKIHVGVNCASISCPKLSNVAFTENNIEANLQKLMTEFINDVSKNKLSQNKLQISLIFDWFKEDFTKNSSLIDYLNQYSKIKIMPTAKISYLEYDWGLNNK